MRNGQNAKWIINIKCCSNTTHRMIPMVANTKRGGKKLMERTLKILSWLDKADQY